MISVKQWRKGKQVELAVNLQSAMFNVEGVSPVLFFDEFLLKGSWLPTSPRAPVILDQIPSNNSLKYTPDLGCSASPFHARCLLYWRQPASICFSSYFCF